MVGKKKFSIHKEAGLMWEDQKRKSIKPFIAERKDCKGWALEMGKRTVLVIASNGNFIYVMYLTGKKNTKWPNHKQNSELQALWFLFNVLETVPTKYLFEILWFTICFICICVNDLSNHIVLIGKEACTFLDIPPLALW